MILISVLFHVPFPHVSLSTQSCLLPLISHIKAIWREYLSLFSEAPFLSGAHTCVSFFLRAFETPEFKSMCQVPLPRLQRPWGQPEKGDGFLLPQCALGEEQRSLERVQLLPAALGFLFLHTKQKATEDFRSCRVTPRLCPVARQDFKLCHLFLFTLTPFIFSVAFLPGLDLEPLRRG